MNIYRTTILLFLLALEFAIAQERPNILVIMFDDAGLDMSAYGSTYVNTPAFDAIAEEGVLFNRAYTPNAKCAPSRAAFITGRNSWQLDAAANHVIYFPPKFKTYQEVLAENGYTTGHTGKGWGPGITVTEQGAERQVTGPAFNDKTLEPATKYIGPNDYSGNFADFIDKAPADRPWSFWVGTVEPHRGYEYGTGVKLGGKSVDMIENFPPYWPDNETTRNDLLDYAFEIEDTDRHIGNIMETLRERGMLENTLIVVTSDHGMPFPRVKGDQYDNSNHVPMAILWKDKMESVREKSTGENTDAKKSTRGKSTNSKFIGREVDDYISFVDLAPTFLEAAEIDWQTSGMHPTPGKSLLNILTSNASGQVNPERNYALIGKERHDTGRPGDVGYPIRGIHRDNMLYLRNYETDRWPSGNPETGYLNTDGSPTKTEILKLRRSGEKEFWKSNFGKRPEEELYDTAEDPFCFNNLADDPKYAQIKKELKSEMESKLLAQGDLRMTGYGHLYEQHPFVKGRGDNFYSNYMSGKNPNSGWVNESDFEPYFLDGEGNELRKVDIGAPEK